MGNRRALEEAFAIALGQAHVPLLVDGVVELLVGDRCNCDTHRVDLGVSEEEVQCHRTAATPAPNADALAVDERELLEHRLDPRRLVGRGENADLPVNRLAPLAAARRRGATVVEAGDDVALLREEQVPHPGAPPPSVQDRLPGGLAVDIDQQRIPLGRVEIRRPDHPAVDLEVVGHGGTESLTRRSDDGVECLLDIGVVFEYPLYRVIRKRHEVGPWHVLP